MEAHRFIQMVRRIDKLDAVLAVVVLVGLAVVSFAELPAGWGPVGWLVIGFALGTWVGGRRQRWTLGATPTVASVVTQDIQTLRQAFEVLRRQVDSTIRTSETAVIAMMERMNRVHANAMALRERIVEAVRRSQALSTDSLDRAGRHGEAVATLAEHQRRAETEQADNQSRVRAVAEQVRALRPLAAQISEISRQTNLLAINASIEAARAGPEGAGFKVVAQEVRRLSTQTAEAARQVSDGISAAAGAIDEEMARAKSLQEYSASDQLNEIAVHLQTMSETLGDVVPYLGELAGHMDSGMETVTVDIIDTLGDMQFQDINRQLLEQINSALSSLSDHFSQIYQLIDGQAPPPPILLEELLSIWTRDYVMQAQRDDHILALEGDRPVANVELAKVKSDEPQQLELATAHGPRIELF